MAKRGFKALKVRCWELCREIVKMRAGYKCEICEDTERLQVDHCFSRGSKALFYTISNLTLLCGDCHGHKTYRRYGYDLRVYELVEEREGREEFERLRGVDSNRGGFAPWQLWLYHEQEEIRLKEKRAEMLGGLNVGGE